MEIAFNKTAFRHGVSEADIEWAITTAVYEKPKEGKTDTFLAVGYSRAGNPLEIGYREFDDGSYYVFHAMKCQDRWLKEAGIGGYYGNVND
ncbi:hypothetical protein FACS1894151_05400 [Spirochaetia bacterium]|nr:hypothetical protein FACS1894151_05400 [Spirochaetia bacterium]